LASEISPTSESTDAVALQSLWLRGGFPVSYTAPSECDPSQL